MKYLLAILIIIIAACTDGPRQGDMRVEKRCLRAEFVVTQWDGQSYVRVDNKGFASPVHAEAHRKLLESKPE